jgi:hypothetical protein
MRGQVFGLRALGLGGDLASGVLAAKIRILVSEMGLSSLRLRCAATAD